MLFEVTKQSYYKRYATNESHKLAAVFKRTAYTRSRNTLLIVQKISHKLTATVYDYTIGGKS